MQAEMTPEQRELIEEFGLLHEQMGGTRMTGRVSRLAAARPTPPSSR